MDKNFSSLSVTAEKWIPIREVSQYIVSYSKKVDKHDKFSLNNHHSILYPVYKIKLNPKIRLEFWSCMD